MKDESVAALLEAGEIQHTDDVIFMLNMVTAMFDRAAETERDQFIGLGLRLLETWRESLETNDDKMVESDAVINVVMGRTS